MSATLTLNWSTENLISFLKEKNLGLDADDFQVLCDQKIDGHIFPYLTEEKLMEDGLLRGPAMKISLEAKKFHDNLSLPQGKTSYFWLFPPSKWSFSDFSTWVSSNWPNITEDKEKLKQIFFTTLHALKEDPTVATEIREIVSNLLIQKKKVSIDNFCSLI
jgi:hypothetical protein